MLAVRRGAALAARRSGSSRVSVTAAVNVASVFSSARSSARAMPLFSNVARRSRCDATVPSAAAQQVKREAKRARERGSEREVEFRICDFADGFGHGGARLSNVGETSFPPAPSLTPLTPAPNSLPIFHAQTKSSRSSIARLQLRVPLRRTAAPPPSR